MFKLTGDEMTAVIYAALRGSPHGDDLNVAKKCAVAVMQAEIKKEEEAAASQKCKTLAMEYLKSGRYDKAIQENMQGQFAPQLVEAPDA